MHRMLTHCLGLPRPAVMMSQHVDKHPHSIGAYWGCNDCCLESGSICWPVYLYTKLLDPQTLFDHSGVQPSPFRTDLCSEFESWQCPSSNCSNLKELVLARRYIPWDITLHDHRCESVKALTFYLKTCIFTTGETAQWSCGRSYEYVATDDQTASPPWCRVPVWGP